MNGFRLDPGERKVIEATVDTATGSLAVELTADCGCGGKIVAHRRKPMIWICERSRWWKPWEKHAKLKVDIRATKPESKP